MKIPAKIKFGAHIVDVLIEEDKRIGSIAGEFNGWCEVIRINKTLSESLQSEVLLHELIEGINYYNQLDLHHQTIEIMGYQLLSIIRDNKLNFN